MLELAKVAGGDKRSSLIIELCKKYLLQALELIEGSST